MEHQEFLDFVAKYGELHHDGDVWRAYAYFTAQDGDQQVWSRTQFYSVDFPKSRIVGKRWVFNNQGLHHLFLTVSEDLCA